MGLKKPVTDKGTLLIGNQLVAQNRKADTNNVPDKEEMKNDTS